MTHLHAALCEIVAQARRDDEIRAMARNGDTLFSARACRNFTCGMQCFIVTQHC